MTKIRKALVVILWKPEPAAPANKILLLRVTEARGGFWQPVTGKVDEHESFAEGALREATEETGFRFERQPQFMGLEYEFVGKEGKPAVEQAFFLPVIGATPPTPTLDSREHVDFRWVDPAEAKSLVKFPTNLKAIERATQGIPPLFLSRAGKFFQEGEEITHERTNQLLHQSIKKNKSGFLVSLGTEELDLIVEHSPRFVKTYDRASGEILLSTGERETLKPETLQISHDNSLTCESSDGFRALFLSPAYYELMKDVRESDGKDFVLHFRGRDYSLAVPS